MNPFDDELAQRLDALRRQNLFRELRRVDSPQSPCIQIGGRPFLNFSSNDYLSLANHPALKEAAVRAVEKFGAGGGGASRLICGSLAPCHELEETLAHFKKTEAALTFSSGYAAALGTLCALCGRDDIVILDKLVHACIVDAAKMSGAKIRVFAHNDLDDLEDKLKWSKKTLHAPGRALVVTEGIFSMDGDAAPLPQIVALKEKYGAWLMVDEAHSTGVMGKNGRGLADECGVGGRIEVQMGTLGKALGASGGFICGTRVLVDFIVNTARTFIFSTAPVPAAAAAATAAIQLVQSEEGEKLRRNLRARITEFHAAAGRAFRPAQPAGRPSTPGSGAIIPLIIGDETNALQAAAMLRERCIFVPAIRWPAVARGAARLRITLSAVHSPDNVASLARALKDLEIVQEV